MDVMIAFLGSMICNFHQQHLFNFTKLALTVCLDETFYITEHVLTLAIWAASATAV